MHQLSLFHNYVPVFNNSAGMDLTIEYFSIPSLAYGILHIDTPVSYEVTYSATTYLSSPIVLLPEGSDLPWSFVLSNDDVFDVDDVIFQSGSLTTEQRDSLSVRF